MNRVEIPCRSDCPDRSPVCHSVCEEYAAFRAAVRADREARAQKDPVEQYQSQQKKRKLCAREYRRKKGHER